MTGELTADLTSIPRVTAALTFDFADLLPATQVIDGPSDSVTTLADRVMTVGDRVYDSSAEDDSLDGLTQAEQYTVQCVNSVSLSGADTLEAARQQVLSDWASARAYVRAFPDRALALAAAGVLSARPARDFELSFKSDENGRHAAVRWGVRVYAQVS